MQWKVCQTQQRVHILSLALMATCPNIMVLLIPEVLLAPGRGTRVHWWEHGEEKISSLYFSATRDLKPATSLCKGSHCLR